MSRPLLVDPATGDISPGSVNGRPLNLPAGTTMGGAAIGGGGSWASLTGKPTTIAGFGITDAFTQAAADALYSPLGHTHSFASLTSKPTTIAGYGITDFNSLGDARWQPLDADLTAIAALATDPFGRVLLTKTDAASLRTYIGAGTSSFDGTFTSLTGKPTTIAGYGITDFNSLGDARWQPLDADLTAIAALATDPFGLQVLTKATAASLRTYIGAGTSSFDGTFTSLTGTPTTIAGYGITDFNSLGDARWQALNSNLTTLTTSTLGDLFYSSASNTLSKLAGNITTTKKYLSQTGTSTVSAAPAWAQIAYTDLTGVPTLPANTTSTASQFFTAYNSTTGAFTKAQPAFSDLSGAAVIGQIPTGVTGTTVALGNHTHAGVYQPADTDLDTWALITPSANAQTLLVHTFAQMRTDLGLVIGTNVQAWDADLDALAALAGTNTIYYRSAANTWSAVTIGTNLTFSAGTLSASGGGSGTVTSFSAGTLSPLFTTSVATATTTPALTFALSNAAAHTVFGNFTASSAAPSFNALGTGIDTWLVTPSSANLAAAITDETGTGALVFANTPALVTPNIGAATGTSVSLSASSTITLAPAANTAAAGFTLTDTTAAAAASQQYSPYLYFTGQGWKTTATAASQSVTFRQGVVPVQGTANPSGNLVIESSINGGAFSAPLNYSSAGLLAFGGTTSSFPAFKRNGTVINARLADDSADAGIYASSLRLTNANALDLSTITGDSVIVGSTGRVIFNNNANNANNLIITDAGDVTARKSLGGTGVTFANVPASPVLGMMIPVTDSTTVTWGATITGGGTNKVLAWYNGTNWTVYGK